MHPDAKPWIEHSEYDLKSALVLLKAGQYLNVLFLYQQAVEKRLKALLVHRTGAMSLRTHDLLQLAAAVGMTTTVVEEVFLRRLTTYYRETRYPDAPVTLGAPPTADEVRDLLDQTTKVLQWCDQQMK